MIWFMQTAKSFQFGMETEWCEVYGDQPAGRKWDLGSLQRGRD